MLSRLIRALSRAHLPSHEPLLPKQDIGGEPATRTPEGLLSAAQADKVFADLLDDPGLQCWDRLEGGCEYRAEIAARRISGAGHLVFKAWAFPHVDAVGVERSCLGQRRQDPVTAKRYYTWGFHVAAAAFVARATARPALTVFDPTLVDGPCTPERWMWAMYATTGRFMITSADVFQVDPAAKMAFLPAPGAADIDERMAAMRGVNDAQLPRSAATGS